MFGWLCSCLWLRELHVRIYDCVVCLASCNVYLSFFTCHLCFLNIIVSFLRCCLAVIITQCCVVDSKHVEELEIIFERMSFGTRVRIEQIRLRPQIACIGSVCFNLIVRLYLPPEIAHLSRQIDHGPSYIQQSSHNFYY